MEIPVQTLQKGKDLLFSESFKIRLKNLLIEEEDYKDDDDLFELYKDDDVKFEMSIFIEFVNFCIRHLDIDKPNTGLKIVLSNEKDKFTTYAFYDIHNKIAAVYCIDRAILDCMRSLAHELVHHKQNISNKIPSKDVSEDNDGTGIENEANSIAGVIMREFGRKHPELY